MSSYVNCGIAQANNLADYKGVFILGEQRDGKIQAVTFELLTWGRGIANELGCELACVILGDEIENLQEIIARGADKVFFIQDPIFKNFLPQPYSNAITKLVNEEKPEIIIAGATTTGRTVMPLVAAKTNTGLTADCTELTIDHDTRLLLQTRPAIGGNIMATILCPEHRPQMGTVRPSVFKKPLLDYNRCGKIIRVKSTVKPEDIRTKLMDVVKVCTTCCNLEEADIIVSGGRGLGKPENFKLVEDLAEVLGATVGASRAAVDAGWKPHMCQVGQTGKTVGPKIYIACGISGAVQHLVGMSSSDIIIAINRDKDAPIFQVANYGIVGDVLEVLPIMTEEFKKRKAC